MSDDVTHQKLLDETYYGKADLEYGMSDSSLLPSSSSSLPLLCFLTSLKLIPDQTRTFGDVDCGYSVRFVLKLVKRSELA